MSRYCLADPLLEFLAHRYTISTSGSLQPGLDEMGFGLIRTRIVSVSELIALLKEPTSLGKNLHSLLHQIDEQDSNPLTSYVRSEPTLPHLLKLLASVMKSSDHEMMSGTLWLLAAALRALAKFDLPAGIAAAKTILNEQCKSVYRCLSSGNPGCLTAAMDLLTTLCMESASTSLAVAVVDMRHKGLLQAARTRKSLPNPLKAFSTSPRAAYVSWVVRMLKVADYETRVALSRHPSVLHNVISGMRLDDAAAVTLVLETLLGMIVFNEEENRNLPVAFLRGNQLSQIAKLMSHQDETVQTTAKDFLLKCYSTAGKGLCYPSEPVNILRNKLLHDLLVDIDPVANDMQDFCLELVGKCPDVLWSYLCSGKIAVEPSGSSMAFAVNVSFVVRMLALLPVTDSTPKEAFVPKSVHRTTMTKGLVHDDRIIRFNTLLLIMALLKRFPTSSSPERQVVLVAALPDFRTIYNSWKKHPSVIVDDEDEFLERCFLEVISLYVELDLVDKDAPSLRVQDFCDVSSPDLADSIIRLCTLLDPASLLLSTKEVEKIGKICQTADVGMTEEMLRTWIRETNVSAHLSLARSKDHWSGILSGICEIFQKPLLFKAGQDPLLQYLRITEPVDDASITADMIVDTMTTVAEECTTVVLNETAEYLDTAKGKISANSPVNFLNSILSVAKRVRVMDSYSNIDPFTEGVNLDVDSLEELLSILLVKWDCVTWLRVTCAALTASDCAKVDLRLLVESGVLGYAIIGLSLSSLSLRRISHFILVRFSALLSASRVRERRQLTLLLSSLAGHLPSSSPLDALPRLEAFFYAEAIPLLLRPDHPMYRPLNELLLDEPTVFAMKAFNRLFFDTNEEWSRELTWCLGWIDRSVGRTGQFLDSCDLTGLYVAENVATLLMMSVEEGAKKIAERLVSLEVLRIDDSHARFRSRLTLARPTHHAMGRNLTRENRQPYQERFSAPWLLL
ncbi:hypothetical protein PSACC_00862 [Paramicrosporidium saccamoebae]|uniref:Nucleolar pre-ribosomal-associated protein 1 C-terminal domain-containing protein n=1 Tax=Paramicrosporidium saccamoebae TaxID=1246581 RepID=A0A2H9TNR8_9FUNG|nr:hypothetical protein PSACC_00862 [Paramicrosporidium saccamoebae]